MTTERIILNEIIRMCDEAEKAGESAPSGDFDSGYAHLAGEIKAKIKELENPSVA